MKNIFTKLMYMMEKKLDTVLVTIVSELGSAPRGKGSQMLVSENGRVIGTIGGGPAEKHAEELCVSLLKEKRSLLYEYRLRENDKEDIGSVCGGDIRVLFQYIPYDSKVWQNVSSIIIESISAKKKAWFIQSLNGGAPCVMGENGEILEGADPKLNASNLKNGQIIADAFPMEILFGERAIIFGAGHCALALAPVLNSVGFRVTVFDEREEWANYDNYPNAEKIICGDYKRIKDYIEIKEDDYIVIMTSGHSFDFEVQEQVLRKKTAYVGVIGSKRKTASVNARLREKGVPEDAILSVHTPIGTPIKAVTPEEIAVSIAGEMIYESALRREKAGEFVKFCPMH